MVGGITNALSGVKNATERLQVSANNIANEFSTVKNEGGKLTNEPYRPQTVVSVSQQQGGVGTEVVPREPETLKRYEPDSPVADENGFVEAPNVDVAEEITNQIVASYDAKANLKSLQTQNETLKSLLDIFT